MSTQRPLARGSSVVLSHTRVALYSGWAASAGHAARRASHVLQQRRKVNETTKGTLGREKKNKLETRATVDKGGGGAAADTVAAALGAVEREELVGAAGVLPCEGDVVARKAGADADAKVVDGAARGARAVGRAHERVGRERAEPRLARPHVAHRAAVELSLAFCCCHRRRKGAHKGHSCCTTTRSTTDVHLVTEHTDPALRSLTRLFFVSVSSSKTEPKNPFFYWKKSGGWRID